MTAQDQHKKPDIKLLILDVDGVLTDGKIYISDDGIETKCFNVQDGLGIKNLMSHGIEVAIISGRKSAATGKRLEELGIKHAYLGVKDKLDPFSELKNKLHIEDENIACVGDDLPDLPIMQKAGFSVAVYNAVEKLHLLADHVTTKCGGDGAVREVCDLILTLKT